MDEFYKLSPVSKAVLVVSATSIAYLLVAALRSVLRALVAGVKRITPTAIVRGRASPSASTASAPSTPAQAKPPPGVSHVIPPSRSLKTLMKQRKGGGAGGAGTGADHHADSELFIATLRGHTDAVTGLAFSADAAALATACEDRTLRVFDVSNPWAKTLPFRHHALRRGAQDVAFGADPRHVAVMTQGVAGAAGLAMVDMGPREPVTEWEVDSLFPGRTAPGLRLVASCSSAAAGGAPVLVAASPGPELRAFSAAGRGALLGKIDTGGMVTHDAAVTPDGRFAAAATFTSDVKLYEVEHDRLGAFVGIKKAMDLKGHKGKVLALAFSPDSKRAVTASADGTLIIWNIDVRYKQQEDPKKLLTAGLPLPRGQCYSRLAWGPGGHIAAVHGGTVHLLDARTGEQVDAIRDAHSGAISDLTWAPLKLPGPQGKAAVLATAGQDGRVRLWRGPWPAV